MSALQNPILIEAIQAAAQSYGMKTLAPALNKRPSTLYAELNPWGDRGAAKLGIEDAVEIMRVTGDIGGLEVMAAVLGCSVRRIGGEPDGRDMAEECAQGFEAVAAFLTAARAGEATYPDLIRLMEGAAKEMEDVVVRARKEQETKPRLVKKAG